MRRGILVASVAAALALAGACKSEAPQGSAPALTDEDRAAVVQTIRGWSDQWSGAFVSRDFSILDTILAPDFIYTVDTGEVLGKQGFIALLENDPITYTRFDGSDVEAHWYGDNVVVLTGVDDVEGHDADGNPVKSRGRWTNMYVNRGGVWQCVTGHSSNVEG